MNGSEIFRLICELITLAGFSLAGYWMYGASLYNRSTSAYLRGDIAEGDRLRQRAKRWSKGS